MLAWMDLEMTGLDPTHHVIVEIAVVLTDDNLDTIAEGPDLVVHQPPAALAAMEDFVRQMHTRSRLIEAIERSTVSLQAAGDAVLQFFHAHQVEPQAVPLCGNSIGTDRSFLRAYLPDVDNYLHYRSVDVSTIKELCRRWYPEAMSGAPDKTSAHRALDDIRESIAELRYYRSAIFRPPPASPPEPPAATDQN